MLCHSAQQSQRHYHNDRGNILTISPYVTGNNGVIITNDYVYDK